MITLDKRYKYLNKLELQKMTKGRVRVVSHPAFTIPGQRSNYKQNHSVPICFKKDELVGFIFKLEDRAL